MKCLYTAIFLYLISSCRTVEQIGSKRLNVLFIGNSLTYFNNMPQMLQAMLDETHPGIRVYQSTFAGKQLSDHVSKANDSEKENSTETERLLTENHWDIIILQTGTISVLIPENVAYKINPAITTIKNMVQNQQCRYLLFDTWPSKSAYPKHYCYSSGRIDNSIRKDSCCSNVMTNFDDEYNQISASYAMVAAENDLLIASITSKYYNVRKLNPDIELIEDDIHPSNNGAFLNACVFYKLITQSNPLNVQYIGSLESNTAKKLKEISNLNYR